MNRKDGHQEFCTAARASAILKEASEEALEELSGLALCHDYPKNNILFYQGDPVGAVFLVLSGRVKITLNNQEGREVIVAMARPGDLFGLVAALDEGSQPANAVTVARSRLAKFDGETFTRWLERNPSTYRSLLAHLGGRLRDAYQKIGEHALLGVKERLMYALLDIAELEGRPDPNAGTIVFTRPTHQELAHRIGSSREVVSRLLKELLESDLLQAEGRIIRVSESALVLREE
jgi:CRP-like cAMP-binding protein